MFQIKICGITTVDDARFAAHAGADAIGFNNLPQSPRYLGADRVESLARDVPIMTVMLTLDEQPAALIALLERTGVKGVQPYGRHAAVSAAAAAAEGYMVLFPTRAEPGLKIESVPGVPLLDTPSQTKLGGTGRTFDWSVAEGLDGDFVLAGGLGPDNIARAVRQIRPWGVDASSGLEVSPGVKDSSMVADFIKRAKNET